MKQWYELLFENYGKKYDSECFTKGTVGECDFIESEIGFNKNIKILDIGCGTGRHSIELSKRGYDITGIDLSESLLKRAKEKAKEENIEITFLKRDARELSFREEFDLALIICEGSFPLMETDEMNFQILKNASNALKESGKMIMTTLNGLFPIFHSVKDFIEQQTDEGNAECTESSFDLLTFREYSSTTVEDDDNNVKKLKCNERYYIPPEITWLLKSAGFKKVDIYGAKLGKFSRSDVLGTEDFEMLVIAEKQIKGNK